MLKNWKIPKAESSSTTFSDDTGLNFGTGDIAKMQWQTDDANANVLATIFPEGGAVDVPVFVIGDATAEKDLGYFNGVTEPTYAVINDGGDAYASLDAGDDSVGGSKGLTFFAAADEDIELLNLTNTTGTPRVYWDENEDQFRSTKGWYFDEACDVQGTWTAAATWTLPALTLGGTMTLNNQSLDAGAVDCTINSTGSFHGLAVVSTQDAGWGGILKLTHVTASPANGDAVGGISYIGKDAGDNNTTYGNMYVQSDNVSEGSETGKFLIDLLNSGAYNGCLKLEGTGVLSVDLGGSGAAAQVDLFDDYDDALVLKEGIQQHNRDLLTDMGILDRKGKDDGSGYMMKVQPMVKLLAGGIYQTRARVDDLVEVIVSAFPQVSQKLAEKNLLAIPHTSP